MVKSRAKAQKYLVCELVDRNHHSRSGVLRIYVLIAVYDFDMPPRQVQRYGLVKPRRLQGQAHGIFRRKSAFAVIPSHPLFARNEP